MESARFRYEPDGGGGDDEEEEESRRSSSSSCFLDIYVHHARGIHNICIYADQDVYARFALTSSPDHTPALSTRVAAGGGADPRFDERLPPLRVRGGGWLATDVLKCEVWMRSCARPLLEDQFLGFVLVPLADVAGADGAQLEREFSLSSTDLFHSPAGTVRLSLALRSGPAGGDDALTTPESAGESTSIASEVVILEPAPTSVDYSRVEFPDLNVVRESHDMAVQYLPFLHLGEARPQPPEDCEMGTTSPRGDKPASSDGSKNASTTTTASDDRRGAISSSFEPPTEKPRPDADAMSCRSPDTPTSTNEGDEGKEKCPVADVFKSPLGDIEMEEEAEQSAMQRQIMEMYVKSMQQFTESLGKMKLPMELDGVVVHKEELKPETEAKKDGSARVFYGSRAFF